MQKISLPSYGAIRLYTPKELKRHLDEYIIGQDEAKKTICVAIYNHYKRVFLSTTPLDVGLEKSNILVTGPTGSGKTYIVKTIADYMGVPYFIGTATGLTESGYVGADVESLLSGLLRKCDFNADAAKYGIVFIDEIDKLAKQSSMASVTKNVGGVGVQQALLKMLEGSVVGVPPQGGRINPEQPLIYLDTSNILFVGMGAFSGVGDIIRERCRPGSGRIGFGSEQAAGAPADFDESNPYKYLSQEDLKKYGFIPEFIGRFPVITNVSGLTERNLVSIMKDTRNSIVSQYQALFAFDGVNLTFDDGALRFMASVAIGLGTGARGIRTLFECTLKDYMYDMPGGRAKELRVTRKVAEDKLSTRYRNLAAKGPKGGGRGK